MSLNIIDRNAEDLLYATLLTNEQEVSSQKFLQCRFFHIAESPNKNDIEQLLNQCTILPETTLYICDDGDLIIGSEGDNQPVYNDIVNILSARYKEKISTYMTSDDFFINYDGLTEIADLKSECRKKLKKQTRQSKELSKYFSDKNLTRTLRNTIQIIQMQRTFRSDPHILIVEDQVFSQKILASILKDFTSYVAPTSGEALLLYMEKCPDILFLDIELPDISGHSFAKFINKIDPQAYIVMATGNKTAEDINTAKDNNVKGFITKPYDKDAIANVIEKYNKHKKKK